VEGKRKKRCGKREIIMEERRGERKDSEEERKEEWRR
jgi:hypothetical protein